MATRSVSAATIAKRKPPAKKAAAKPAAAKPTAMDYGYVESFLKEHPDVGTKVKTAVAQGWTAARLQAEIKTTGWWTSRSESQRQWDILTKDNPAEAQKQLAARHAAIAAQATALGVTLDADMETRLAEQFSASNASAGEMQTAIAHLHSTAQPGQAETGQAAITADSLQAMSTAYGITLSSDSQEKYMQAVLAGDQTTQGLQDHFREQAKVLYRPIADWLDKNPTMTVKDYLSPYMNVAQNELGIPAEQMQVSDPKWSAALSDGNGQPMSVDQWTQKIRTDQQYGWDYTVNARTQASQLAMKLQQTFGAS